MTKTLYDIHTHRLPTNKPAGYKVVSILNTYPLEADLADIEDIYYSSGIHPWYMDNAEEQFKHLTEIASNPKLVAIGEAGLDRLKGADWNTQQLYFRKQIQLAMDLQKPLIIHCVKAWDELIRLYKEYKPRNSWIVHGYRGKLQQAEQLLGIGLKISIGAHSNPETVKKIPLDSLLCETDTSDSGILTIYQEISRNTDICIDDIAELIGVSANNAFKM